MADERQVFVYKGVEYSLSSKLTPAEAKAKIQAHLGESTTQPQEPLKAQETPQEPFKEKRSTSLWEDIKSGAGSAANLVDLAASSLYAFPQSNENVRQIMDAYERRAKVRNQELGVPKDAVQGPVGKIVSGLAAFPASPLGGAQTAKTFKESGENNNRAATAGVTDTVAQAFGLLIPGAAAASVPFRAGVGAGSNALQELVSNAVIKEIATKEDTRKKFELSTEDLVASALSGGAFGAIHGDGRKKSIKNPKLDALKDIDASKNKAKTTEASIPEQLELPLETSPQSIREMQTKGSPQMDLFEIANQPHERMPTTPDAVEPPAPRYGEQPELDFGPIEQGDRAFQGDQFGDGQGHVVLDENGMPIRADLSMEAANLENPLQMNMWGDELGPALDQTRSLTDSIDRMRETGRTAQGQFMPNEFLADTFGRELDTPVPKDMAREGPFSIERDPTATRPAGPRSQRGAIDPDFLFTLGTAGLYPVVKGASKLSFKEGFNRANRALSMLTDQPWLKERFPASDFMTNPDGTPAVLLHGSTATFDGSPRAMDEGFHAGHASSPHMFAGGNKRDLDGMLLPKAHESLIDYTKGTGGRERNGKIYPVAIRRGNYPEIGVDFNNWSAKNLLTNKGFRNALARITGKDQSEVGTVMDKYSEQVFSLYDNVHAQNNLFSKMLKDEFGIDGFTYKNEVESVKSALGMSTQTRFRNKAKHYGDTNSFVTWDDNNFQAIYKEPSSTSYNRFGQGGSQTILTDLGLGIYNTVTKPKETARKLLDKISAGYIKDTEIPKDVPVEDILNSARNTSDTKAINALEAGNTMRGYKGRAQWVHDAGEYLLNRLKRSELNIRNYVTGNTGAEKFMRSLSKNEQIELAGLLKEEMLNRRQFDPADMAAAGFNAKQLEAYAKLRKMQEAALAALNYGRKVHNLPEITAQEAYLTSKWNGEVKMRVEDANGKLVYYLAGNSERDVKKQLAALKQEHPEYKGGKIDRIRQTFNGSDVQKAYSIMADAIGRDNPEFQKVQEWYSQYQATQAHDSMGTRKHFEDKANIRGFVGDRPGYNPKTEAIALLQEQMNFAKESFHWAALQDAAVALSPIFQDPMIRDNHPNNLRYLQEQLAIAAGANEGSFSRGVNDGIRSLGFTPAQVFGGAQKAKSWFMFQKLSMNLGYGAANLLQLPFTIPHLIDIANKVGGFNPARSLAVATTLGLPMAGTHYSRQLAGIDLLQNIPDKNFYKSLMDYAEQNGVTSRSIVDEAPLDAGVIGRVGNFTTSAPETVIRSFAFTLFADSLKQTGKLSDIEVFKEAERRTNAALGDFRETQRAPIFSRMGNVGNILNTLQTFGINYYQQMNYFMRESLKGNMAPLAAMLAIQFGLSGLSGMPGVQTAEKGWEMLKGILPNSVWAKVGDFDPRIWAYEKFGATGVDGVLSTSTGVSFNSRIGAPAIEEMAQAPGGPIMEVGKQLLSVGQLAMKPDDKVQQAETAMKLLPAGFTGALETGPFRDQTSVDRKDGRMYFKSTDLNKRDAGYVRSPEEENLRKYGFRSTKEVTTRNLEWKQTKYKQELNERRRSFSDSFFDAVMSGNTKKAAEIDANAVAVFGKSLVDNTMKTQLQQMYMTSYERAQSDASKLTPTELIRLKNIKDILDKYQ